MENQHKPKILRDGLMTISSNAEGIQFTPSPLLKALFGEKVMSDVYYKRATKPTKSKKDVSKSTEESSSS